MKFSLVLQAEVPPQGFSRSADVAKMWKDWLCDDRNFGESPSLECSRRADRCSTSSVPSCEGSEKRNVRDCSHMEGTKSQNSLAKRYAAYPSTMYLGEEPESVYQN